MDEHESETITTNKVLMEMINRLEKRLKDIEDMLDSRSPTLREAAASGQTCPSCDGVGYKDPKWSGWKCTTCNGTGHV